MPYAATVTVRPLHAADIPMPPGYVRRPDGGPARRAWATLRTWRDAQVCPCLSFAVDHPVHGTSLVDTGLHPDALGASRSDFGWPMRLVFRGLRPVPPAFDAQLRRSGVEPTTVERVFMTHLHVDHTSGMRLLPRAQFVCSAAEWAAAGARTAPLQGYVRRHLPDASRMTQLDLERDGVPFGPFQRTHDVFGDGSVRLLSTPGHTAGHLSVLLRVAADRHVLLAGDAVYATGAIATGALPLITDDDDRSTRSIAALRAFVAEHPETLVIPSHDPEAWRRLR